MTQDNEAERLITVERDLNNGFSITSARMTVLQEAAALIRTQAARIAELEAEVREMALQAISDGSQAQEAYAAQLKAEAHITDLTARLVASDARGREMTRRRDEWRKKAEGYDAVRLALREKVGSPWPPHMSRLLWAGIAADEKKRADDAEARVAELEGANISYQAALKKHGIDGSKGTEE